MSPYYLGECRHSRQTHFKHISSKCGRMSPPYGNAGGHIIEDTPCAFFFSLQRALLSTSKARAAMWPLSEQTKKPTGDNKERHTTVTANVARSMLAGALHAARQLQRRQRSAFLRYSSLVLWLKHLQLKSRPRSCHIGHVHVSVDWWPHGTASRGPHGLCIRLLGLIVHPGVAQHSS